MDRRRNAIYVIVILSLLAGLITGREIFFNVAYAFTGLLCFSFVWVHLGVNWLRLRRQTRARRAVVGGFLEESFTVRNTSVLPKLWIEVYDRSDLLGHQASHVVSSLPPRAEASWSVRTLCIRRGAFQLGPLRVVTGDPFGLFQAERRINSTSPLIVYPPTIDILDFPLSPGVLPGGDALRRRSHHITANAAGVRDYAPGDSLNRIHWRSTARKARLIVKEFELDPLTDLWIFMDAERTVHVGQYRPTNADVEALAQQGALPRLILPPTTEEYAVCVAASLARYFLQRQRSVGFATHGQRSEILQVDRGPRQLTKILETLAVIEACGTLAFDQLLSLHSNQMARGTTAILITPSTRWGWVGAAQGLLQRGLSVVAILIDAESFGGRPGTEQVAVRLAMSNIPVYVVHRDADLLAELTYRRY